jgi:tetratricopeptide (TPR) repeat protein
MVANLLGGAPIDADMVDQIVAGAEGNPLFIEQMLSMLLDGGALRQQDGRWVRNGDVRAIDVPPTIQALLEARLDTLGRDMRATVESASVVGLEFLRPAVEAVSPEPLRSTVGKHLASLSYKKFIDRIAALQAEARFRFHHQMIRDTAYRGLLKRARARMHIALVRWADTVASERGRAPESDDILGFHLEQAHRYLAELGPPDAEIAAIGRDAAQRLGGAARRAFARGDMHSAAGLFRRAAALLPSDDVERLTLLSELGEALMESGDFAAAQAAVIEAATAAERTGQQRAGIRARLVEMLIQLFSAESKDWGEKSLRVAHAAIERLQAEGAHAELAMAWRLIAFVHGSAGRYGVVASSLEACIAHARRANDERLIARTALGLSTSALYGPAPVSAAIAQCRTLLAQGFSDRQAEGSVMCTLGQLLAMNGECGAARSMYRNGRTLLRELGQGVNAASTSIDLARIALLDDVVDPADVDEVQADLDFLRQRGETYFLSTLAARLAALRRSQGRHADADSACRIAEESAAGNDIESQVLWRLERASQHERLGRFADSEALARAALDLARTTESPGLQFESLAVLASSVYAQERFGEAMESIEAAMTLAHAKGDTASLARMRATAARFTAVRPRR